MMIERPEPGEYNSVDAGYIDRVPDGDVFDFLAGQPDRLRALLQNTWDSEAGRRPAPNEWSIKEVFGHICDQERIFAYRMLCISRGDPTPLPGFEPEAYVNATDFNARTLASLLDEFDLQRRANLICFQTLDEFELSRRGKVNGGVVSARAILYLMAGHVAHHLESLQFEYDAGKA